MILKNLLKTLIFALILAVLFITLRIIFIVYVGILHNEMNIEQWNISLFLDSILCLYNGMQYDNRIVALFTILYLIFSFIFKDRGLKIFTGFFISIIVILGIGNMVFFLIYHDIYNSNLLGLIFDDRIAILQTGLSGEYFISIKILCAFVIVFIFLWFYQKSIAFINTLTFKKYYLISTISIAIFLLLLLTFFINASFSFKGKSLDQQITPSQNLFLKKITTDSFRALYFVYKGYKVITKSSMSDFYPKDIKTTLQEYFDINTNPPYDIYKLLEQSSQNTASTKIRHIFYIVSESLSKWHFEERFDDINLMSATKNLIKNPHTISIDYFLENAPSTAKSLDSQISGLLQLDIPLHTLIGKIPSFKTSIANIVKKLHYQTYFYYGGSGNWQKLDTFTHSQGFNKLFDESFLLNFAKQKDYPSPYKNIWGVSDNVLFDFILENTTDTPSFNMIMTTSNHPPYDIPLEKYGVPLQKIQDFIDTNHLPISAKILGHIYWYDKILIDFIEKMSKKYPDSLFIITGDHYDRNYPNNPNIAITKQIPCIIYAPTLSLHKTTNIGAHIDIAPTIIELISHKDFKYSSFGNPLASTNANFKIPNKLALGYFVIGNKDMLYTPNENPIFITKQANITHIQTLYEKLNQAKAISWYLIFKNQEVQK